MEALIPILIAAAIALLIPLAMKWWRQPEITTVENRIRQLRQLPAERAVNAVRVLEHERRVAVRASGVDHATLGCADRFGVQTRHFAEHFAEVAGGSCVFWAPSEARTLKEGYYVIGLANDEHTRYLLKEGSDEVLVWDVEDPRIDRVVSFPTIWHAILFEVEGPFGHQTEAD